MCNTIEIASPQHIRPSCLWGGLLFFMLFNIFIAGQTFADGVTIITHGYNPSISGTPAWLESMRDAISAKHLGGEQNYGIITVTKSETGLAASCNPWNFDMTSGKSGEILIIIDWSNVADHIFGGGPPAQEVAAAVIERIISGQNGRAPLAELPIHLIGHSRGGGMVCEIARLLGEKGIIVDHLTPLDPHPLTTNDTQPLFKSVIDTPTAVYENVIFADVYHQNAEYPTGESISGAYNRLWGTMSGGYHTNNSEFANHRNIYLMYQGTVDLSNPVNNGEASMGTAERSAWFAVEESSGDQTGFCFSRIKGKCVRKIEGIHNSQVTGGSGARNALAWSGAVWPNIAGLDIYLNGSVTGPERVVVPIGAILDLRYVALDYDSNSTVTLFADADRNSYNSNDIQSLADPVQHTATNKTFTEKTISWDTSQMTEGQEIYIYAKITDGTRTRYFYAPAQLVFNILKGDIVRNGKVDLNDAVEVLKILTKTGSKTISIDADVNGDGKIGLADAVYILQSVAKP